MAKKYTGGQVPPYYEHRVREVIKLRMEGKTFREIAPLVGVSVQQAWRDYYDNVELEGEIVCARQRIRMGTTSIRKGKLGTIEGRDSVMGIAVRFKGQLEAIWCAPEEIATLNDDIPLIIERP